MPIRRSAADQAVCIGPPPAAQSYLSSDRILAAAREPVHRRSIQVGFPPERRFCFSMARGCGHRLHRPDAGADA
jgi:hypothetical protein